MNVYRNRRLPPCSTRGDTRHSNTHQTLRDSIALEYYDVGEGETRAGQSCPACGGGEAKERSFSVSRREGLLLWTCHRASCHFRGADACVLEKGRRTEREVQCRGVVGRTYSRTSEVVGEQAKRYLSSQYAITEQHLQKYSIGWVAEESRLCLPVFNYQGEMRGANLRALDGRHPKSKLHAESNSLAWYPRRDSRSLIVVEDQFSAIRAADYVGAVALLGTHLDDIRAEEIKASKLSPIYLALDKDAWNKTIKYCIQYRSMLGLIPLRLEKDIKNMTTEELDQLMKGVEK